MMTSIHSSESGNSISSNKGEGTNAIKNENVIKGETTKFATIKTNETAKLVIKTGETAQYTIIKKDEARAASNAFLSLLAIRANKPRTFLFPIVLILIGLGTLLILPRFFAHATTQLPGQQIWKQNVSSWLFGTNDASWTWSASNPGSNPAIAATIKAAGITLVRTPLHSSDANARVSVVEAAGAQCLGILQPSDAEQVVQALGPRCNLYEWMNEPDNGGPSASQYAASWNQEIPRLRAINPQALFIGPVVAFPDTNYIKQFLSAAQASNNLPDLISYHMYPCTDQSISACPSHISDFGQAAQSVNNAVQSVVGHTIPLAVTEWNYSWKPGQTPQNDPYMGTFTQQAIQAMAQAGVVMANQFDLASNAGGGGLDMVHPQSGQSTPQLQAMQALIAQYSTGAIPTITASIPASMPTSTGTSTTTEPTPVGEIPAQQGAPGIVGNGSLLSAQQLTCPPPASATNINICNFLIQVTTPNAPQQVLLTWWNEGATIPSKVSISISGDSTDGHNGTWTSWPSSLSTGGVQLMPVPGQTHWINVHLEVPAATTGPVIGAIELYGINVTNGATPAPSHMTPAEATPTAKN
jgi:hypothetical protein